MTHHSYWFSVLTIKIVTILCFAPVISARAGQVFGGNLPYLDKIPPAPADLSNRYYTCPIADAASKKFNWRGEEIEYTGNEDVQYDKPGWGQRVASRWTTGLQGLVPKRKNTFVSAIDIRKSGGKRKYLYLGSDENFYTPFETWSSSKFIVSLNLARRLREESRRKFGAENEFGLNSYATINGSWGRNRHVGELITWQHSYEKDTNNLQVSNTISTLFIGLGIRSRLNDLVYAWLNRPLNEMFIGAYGARDDDRSVEFTSEDGRSSMTLSQNHDLIGEKKLSTVTLNEALRRILADEELGELGLGQSVAFPGVEPEDIKTLLYGAPSESQGGMTKGLGVYLHEALGGKENLDAKTNGQWRIFSKIGLGYGEFVLTAAVCLPYFDGGREFILSAHVNDNSSDVEEDKYLYNIVKNVTGALVPGFVENGNFQ